MKKQGFTLIELLVVISIIGLLSSIVYTSLKNARDKAKIAAGLSFSQSLYHALGAEAVGVWSFEDITGGQTPDGSGNGNNGTIYGNPVQEDSGIPALRQALKFDGAGDYVDAGNGASLSPASAITVEAWVKSNSASETAIVAKYSGGYNGYMLLPTRFSVYNGGAPGGDAGYTLDVGVWTHIAGTYDGTTVSVYKNGQLQSSAPYSGDIVYGGASLIIGKASHADIAYFNGPIDEVRIYGQALTTAEIQKHYAEGLGKFNLVKN